MKSRSAASSDYLPIAEHGVIGDLHTVALVGTEGTIDWYCCPHFDSPSVFGSILDAKKGGHFRLQPAADDWTSRQLYFPDTNVLITRFLTPEGVAEIEDFMPIAPTKAHAHRHRLLRRVLCVRGQMRFRVDVQPRFNYARDPHETRLHPAGVVFVSRSLSLALSTRIPLRPTGDGVDAEFTMKAGESAAFVLERVESDHVPSHHPESFTLELFQDTVDYWRRWLSKSKYTGRWREMVHRSALTLKLLTYQPTGAIVAAATTSLPEQIGGGRNWDYRYTWIRDAAFSLYGLLRLGFTDEAAMFFDWLDRHVRHSSDAVEGPLQVMYGVDGRTELEEIELDHLEGYRGSRPVRIGNGAYKQLQLDIYGELLDSVYLYNKFGRPIGHDVWQAARGIVDWVCENWDRPDEGIWEVRGGRKDFTYSRLMCWVAIERAIRVARQRGLPANMLRWLQNRDAIYDQIMDKGWHEGRQAFVQHYDSDVLDASLLMMPLVKFVAPTDPRWLSTLDAMSRDIVSDSLVYRYDLRASPDGLDGEEGTFSICSFWYVEALAWAGRIDEARLVFEKMLTYANHLGLYSEEVGPTGDQLGNFPQAFTHLALISAAFNLDRKLG